MLWKRSAEVALRHRQAYPGDRDQEDSGCLKIWAARTGYKGRFSVSYRYQIVAFQFAASIRSSDAHRVSRGTRFRASLQDHRHIDGHAESRRARRQSFRRPADRFRPYCVIPTLIANSHGSEVMAIHNFLTQDRDPYLGLAACFLPGGLLIKKGHSPGSNP